MNSDLYRIYNIPKLSAKQLEQVKLGLQAGVNVSAYAKPGFTAKQMKQIRLGLKSGLPVCFYAKPEFSANRMNELRLALLEGIDISSYAKQGLKADELRIIREQMLKHIKKKYLTVSSDKAMVSSGEFELTLDNYILPTINTVMTNNLYLVPVLQNLVNWKMQYSQEQLGQISVGLWLNADVTRYLDPKFKANHMLQIRLGLEKDRTI